VFFFFFFIFEFSALWDKPNCEMLQVLENSVHLFLLKTVKNGQFSSLLPPAKAGKKLHRSQEVKS
jgi:hypothetical protein